jgi:hypothetical protein
MTRNRAILADIVEFKLDPTVAHTNTHASGRLSKHKAVTGEVTSAQDVVVVEPKNALVEVPEAAKEPEKPEEVVVTNDETPPPPDAEEEKVEVTASKKKGKKNPTE